MLSTRNLQSLPDVASIKRICKAASVLDAIICPEWEYRYYSFNAQWGDGEEFCEIRNGQGDHTLILFKENSCVINGFMHEYKQPDKLAVTKGLPEIFQEFIFGEPVSSIGTTFCIWKTENNEWKSGKISAKDGSQEVLFIFDNKPQTYLDWAMQYFDEFGKEQTVSLQTIEDIYIGKTLTKNMVLNIVPNVENWKQLVTYLEEIEYQTDFV